MADVTRDDIRARLQVIAGQAAALDVILQNENCPSDRWGMIDFCTKTVQNQLARLVHVLAQGKRED